MIDLIQYLSSITLKTAEKRLFWAFLKPIWVLKGIKIIFFTIISLYNDFWGQTKPLTTPNRDRLDTPHIIPYVQCPQKVIKSQQEILFKPLNLNQFVNKIMMQGILRNFYAD